VISLARTPKKLLALVPFVFLSLGMGLQPALAVDEPEQTDSTTRPSGDPIEQALIDLKGEDAAARNKAAEVLIEKGDASLIPRLDEIREMGGRAVRQAVKPVVDVLKNRANLESDSPDFRRSAASDLASTGRKEAIPYLKQAAEKEQVWWVRYTMEESQHFLELNSGDSAVRLDAVKKLGELRSLNSVTALKELVEAAQQADATDQQKILAAAAEAAIDRIESWSSWANAIETLFRGISLSSILLIMSLGLAIVFGLMGVINMAHGEFLTIGAYSTVMMSKLAEFFPSILNFN
jgi:urea transport system permease protein